jgi:hypothetical protein
MNPKLSSELGTTTQQAHCLQLRVLLEVVLPLIDLRTALHSVHALLLEKFEMDVFDTVKRFGP